MLHDVSVDAAVGVLVGTAVGVLVGVAVGVLVGVAVGVLVGVAVDVTVGADTRGTISNVQRPQAASRSGRATNNTHGNNVLRKSLFLLLITFSITRAMAIIH
jgi:hypothetical protein